MIPIFFADEDFYYVEDSLNGEGTELIEWWHENPTRDVKSESFLKLFETFLLELRNNEFVFEPERLMGLINRNQRSSAIYDY